MCYLPSSAFPRWTWGRGTKWMLCVALGMSLVAAGCGGSSTGTVSGKVYFKDAPLKGGTVTFSTKDKKISKVAEIKEDGSYEIDRMPAGEALIAVDTSELKPSPMAANMPMNAPPPGAKLPSGYKIDNPKERAKRYVEIPAQYADPDKSGLNYTVQKGKQAHDIKLQ